MSLSPLLPIASSAVSSLAAQAADTLADGLSFADVLVRQVAGKTAKQKSVDDEFVALNDTKAALRSVRGATGNALDQFQKVVVEKLEQAGIDTSRPIRLRGDGHGRVIVDGDHPQRAEIEQILREDMSLTGLFNYLAANFRLLHSRGQHRIDIGDERFYDFPRPNVIDDAAQFQLTIDAGRVEVAVQ